MPLMYITEYDTIPLGAEGAGIQIPQEPPLAIQVKDFTAGTTPSDAFHDDTKFISVQLDVDGHVQFAGTPVATTTTSHVYKANAISWHGVPAGSKVAAVAI